MLTQTFVAGIIRAAIPLMYHVNGLVCSYFILRSVREEAFYEKDWGEPAESIIMGAHLAWFLWLVGAIYKHLPPVINFWFNKLPLK